MTQLSIFHEAPSLNCEPAFKWAGAKGWLADCAYLYPAPDTVAVYHEPFAGSAALFFRRFAGKAACLNDTNPRLVATLLMLRDKPHDVIQAYCFMADGYNAAPNKLALYLHVRGLVNAGDLDPVYTAASFLFIINAGFNGLWRVNKSGACNTPHGDGLPLQVDSERLLACSRALQSAIVTCGDFEPVIDAATDGGFILADPPYDPVSATASFDTYSAGGFSWADRERLVAALSRAASRGVRFTLTDSDTSRTRALYAHWRIDRMMVGRSINSDPTKRGRVGELVVTNGWRR